MVSNQRSERALPFLRTIIITIPLKLFITAKAYHGREECINEEHQASISGRATLLLSNHRQAILCVRLRQWRRGE